MSSTRKVTIRGKTHEVKVDPRSELRSLLYDIFTKNLTLDPPLTDAEISDYLTKELGKPYPKTHVAVARFRYNRGDYGPVDPGNQSVAYRGVGR